MSFLTLRIDSESADGNKQADREGEGGSSWDLICLSPKRDDAGKDGFLQGAGGNLSWHPLPRRAKKWGMPCLMVQAFFFLGFRYPCFIFPPSIGTDG